MANPTNGLSLAEAVTIATAALAKAREGEMSPMAVAVLDAAGTIKCSQTEDGAALMRPDIAYAKAWGCLGLGFSTRAMANLSQQAPALLNAFGGVSENRLIPSPGGVFIVRDGQVIGAVGVSGDHGDNDEVCSLAGIEAAGLEAKI